MLTRPYIHTSPIAPLGKRQRAIVVIGPAGTIPERLSAGLARELPWALLCLVDTADQAARMFPETVSLILLHPDAAKGAEQSISQIRRFHPLALIGLLKLETTTDLDIRTIVEGSSILQGMVPLDTRVHEFVAIISFMLRGGEYFPREMFSWHAAETAVVVPPEVQVEEAATLHLAHLTRRELEIIELVSKGLQNKSIASQLGLSEFTVKIHLHNIITKLGAHNRTQAVAFFRDGQQKYGHDADHASLAL